MRTSIIILTIAALVSGCDSANAPGQIPDDEGESPATSAIPFSTQLVNVVNTTSQPVPTQAVGTTTVAGTVSATQSGTWTVSGNVNASQSGEWSVRAKQEGPWSVGAVQQGPWSVDIASSPPVTLAPGSSVSVSSIGSVGSVGSLPPVTIAGTPAVTIANMPNVGVSGTVAIANTDDDEAVPVRVVSGEAAAQGGQTPWVGGGQLLIDPGEAFESENLYQVPTGKRLVIEFMTVEAQVPVGQIAMQATLLTSADGMNGATLKFPLQPSSDNLTNFDSFSMVQNMKVNNRASVVVAVTRSSTTATAIANVAMSGYLVDAP